MSLRRLIPLLAVLVLCAAPGSALAAGTKGYKVYEPPGKAGASEYAEVVPTSGGGTKAPTTLSHVSGANLARLGAGKSTARRLAKLGAAGADAAGWARATAPVLVQVTSPGSATPTFVNDAALKRGSAASGLLDLLDGSDAGGLGTFLPLLLGITLAAAVGFAIGRRRRPDAV